MGLHADCVVPRLLHCMEIQSLQYTGVFRNERSFYLVSGSQPTFKRCC